MPKRYLCLALAILMAIRCSRRCAPFEYHPEFKGTAYETELGLLGSQWLQGQGW